MEEKTIYVASDGLRFDLADECLLWEKLRDKHRKIDTYINGDLEDETDKDTIAIALFHMMLQVVKNKEKSL